MLHACRLLLPVYLNPSFTGPHTTSGNMSTAGLVSQLELLLSLLPDASQLGGHQGSVGREVSGPAPLGVPAALTGCGDDLREVSLMTARFLRVGGVCMDKGV
jgi:hypothetical protein